MDKKILVVEDSAEMQLAIKLALQKTAQIIAADSGEKALAAIKDTKFDLIILDIGLPDRNGFEVCTLIREEASHRKTPIVFLTGSTSTEFKIRGFDVGGDDYIIKPFDPLELQARIASKLKRFQETDNVRELLTKGPFKLAFSQQKLFITENHEEADLALTSIEFKIMCLFFQNEGKTLRRNDILDFVWGKGVHVTQRSIDSHVYTLRKKLGKYSDCISSVFRVGYKFSADPSQVL